MPEPTPTPRPGAAEPSPAEDPPAGLRPADLRPAVVAVGHALLWVVTRTVWPAAALAMVSAWHAALQLPGDVRTYRTWITGPLPSWQVPGPYPVVADALWWPLRWVHGLNANPVWVLGWTGPATVIACLMLWRWTARPVLTVNTWLLAAAILERSYWIRLEPIPAALTLAALIAARRRRTAASGLLLALGSLIKVWPVFLAPLAWAQVPARSRLRWSAWFAAPWVLFAGTVLALRPAGATTWLTFTFTRRIQIESLTALIPEWAMAMGSHSWRILFRKGLDSAYIIVGPHLRTVHSLLEAVGLLVLAVIGLRLIRRVRAGHWPEPTDPILGRAQLSALLVLVLSGPVFSPQYLIWFAPVLVLALGDGLMRSETAIWLLGCLLTTAEYPFLSVQLVAVHPLALAVLSLRDLVLVWLLLRCLRSLWIATRESQQMVAPPTAPTVPASPATPDREPSESAVPPASQL